MEGMDRSKFGVVVFTHAAGVAGYLLAGRAVVDIVETIVIMPWDPSAEGIPDPFAWRNAVVTAKVGYSTVTSPFCLKQRGCRMVTYKRSWPQPNDIGFSRGPFETRCKHPLSVQNNAGFLHPIDERLCLRYCLTQRRHPRISTPPPPPNMLTP